MLYAWRMKDPQRQNLCAQFFCGKARHLLEDHSFTWELYLIFFSRGET
jgi:hypothetical protein